MREFLKGLDLDKETIDTIMAEHGKLMTSTKEALAAANDKVKTTEDALKRFEGVDVDKLTGEIETLRNDLATKDTEHQAKIADMTFTGGLTSAISALKGKNAKAITAMLDLDTLKGSKNQEADIKAALDALKESDGYLFDTDAPPPPYASDTGKGRLTGPSKEDYAKMSYAERLELKEKSPDTYEKLKG